MKLSEVLKERDAQLQMKRILTQMNKENEENQIKAINKIQSEKQKRDDELDIAKKENTARLADFHKSQYKIFL
jgi:predicted Zn-ribbon and HTH transcriptional regulator